MQREIQESGHLSYLLRSCGIHLLLSVLSIRRHFFKGVLGTDSLVLHFQSKRLFRARNHRRYQHHPSKAEKDAKHLEARTTSAAGVALANALFLSKARARLWMQTASQSCLKTSAQECQ